MQAHEGQPKLTKKKLNKVRCADWTDAKWQHRQTVREKNPQRTKNTNIKAVRCICIASRRLLRRNVVLSFTFLSLFTFRKQMHKTTCPFPWGKGSPSGRFPESRTLFSARTLPHSRSCLLARLTHTAVSHWLPWRALLSCWPLIGSCSALYFHACLSLVHMARPDLS